MGEFRAKSCRDIDSAELKKPDKYECEECVKTNSTWVHLRKCQECGVTLCCDSSPNKHATAHFYATKHPVIISAEPGETWAWCHKHEIAKNNFFE